MPDCHAMCADLEQAKKEFMIRFDLCISVLENIGLAKDDYEIAMRFTKDFYAEHKISSLKSQANSANPCWLRYGMSDSSISP